MKKKRFYEGYLTVEASFLIPVTFMILMLLIYWGFYCYDKCVSVQCSYIAALRGSNQWEMSESQKEQYTMEQLEKLTQETILYVKTTDLHVDTSLTEIRAGVSGGINILASVDGKRKTDRWNMESEKKAYNLKPTSYIRVFRIFGDNREG